MQHDKYQVDQFETAAINILREKGIEVENICRFSDTCSAQFWSKHCNKYLRNFKTKNKVSGNVTWLYFEAHEGKNLSHTIGSLTKQAFTRGLKTKDVGITNIDDIITLIMENINQAAKKFENFLIVKMEPCIRPSKEDADRLAEPLEGISRFQSIWIDQYDKLRGVELSC